MTKALLGLLGCLLALAAQAQSPSPSSPPATAPPATTLPATALPATALPARPELSAGRRDTLYALGNLYARRRRGGLTWLGVSSGVTAAIVRGLADGSNTSDAGGAVVSIAVLAGIPAGIGVSKMIRFSEAHEDEADRAYRSGQPLPRSLSRRLRRKDFH